MGITIHYRGSLNDLDRVEEFEDRVLDVALSLGGEARIWRSAANDPTGRLVRGVMLDLYPAEKRGLARYLGFFLSPTAPTETPPTPSPPRAAPP